MKKVYFILLSLAVLIGLAIKKLFDNMLVKIYLGAVASLFFIKLFIFLFKPIFLQILSIIN